jgi:hypothetical protein
LLFLPNARAIIRSVSLFINPKGGSEVAKKKVAKKKVAKKKVAKKRK